MASNSSQVSLQESSICTYSWWHQPSQRTPITVQITYSLVLQFTFKIKLKPARANATSLQCTLPTLVLSPGWGWGSYHREGASAKRSTKPVGLSISVRFTCEKVTLHDTDAGPVVPPDRPSHIPKTQTPNPSAAAKGSATSQVASYLRFGSHTQTQLSQALSSSFPFCS